ncbi:MAG: DUF503 domain-containing protein [Bacillota bacterium]|nr:DUF503 domain-containing protein [Bacillota bacterium]MDW7729994.1 DUF503 domain-containing protein [Bacillota bacterium]
MRVAICLLELHIHESTSLKSKRRVIKSIIHRLRNQFNVSVSEVGSQDLWQRSELGLAVVCHNGAGADKIMESIFSFIEKEDRVEIISTRVENY